MKMKIDWMKLKKTVVAGFAVAALAAGGYTQKAEAVDISTGDLVLAIFGNGQEWVQNLGQSSGLLTSGGNFTVGSGVFAPITGAGGNNTLRWALIGYTEEPSFTTSPTGQNSFSLFAGSSKAPSQMTPTEISQIVQGPAFNAMFGWAAQSTTGDGSTEGLIPAADFLSYTSNFFTDGTMAGSFPITMEGNFSSTLNILEVFGDNSFNHPNSTVANWLINPDGSRTLSITPAPVPLPAAVVLFSSGLVGLIGVARRKMFVA